MRKKKKSTFYLPFSYSLHQSEAPKKSRARTRESKTVEVDGRDTRAHLSASFCQSSDAFSIQLMGTEDERFMRGMQQGKLTDHMANPSVP